MMASRLGLLCCLLALSASSLLLCPALADGIARVAKVKNRASMAVATIQMSINVNPLSKGAVAKAFQTSNAPRFLAANFEKNMRLTIFLPTNRAYYRYLSSWPKAHCTQPPFSTALAQLMLPGTFRGADLKRLKRGTKLRTMSTTYVTVLSKPTDKAIVLGVVNGYQGIVSKATVVKTDAFINTRVHAVIHYLDNVLTQC